MQKTLLAVDRFSTFIGKAFSWTVVLLTLMVTAEVFSRYVLNKPHGWVLDAQIMLYGTMFMTAGAPGRRRCPPASSRGSGGP